MPLYMCRACGSVDNTATGEYWRQQMDAHEAGAPFEPKCSACDTGKWHGEFERRSADGFLTDKSDRYVYSPQEAEGYFKHLGPFHPVTLPARNAG
jgi:hypothetical protein